MNEMIFPSIGVSRLRVARDGDGITTLIAGYGCSLRCRYCLNPQCFEAPKALHSYGLQELLEAVKIDDLYFQATDGGLVFGGGEPLLHAAFIHAFRKLCPKVWKMHLETSLAVKADLLEMVIEDIDDYMIDIKDMNPEIYQAYTGRPQTLMLENLKHLAGTIPPERLLIRVPLIPGFNTEKDRQCSIEKLKALGLTRFDLFTYDPEAAQSKSRGVNSL